MATLPSAPTPPPPSPPTTIEHAAPHRHPPQPVDYVQMHLRLATMFKAPDHHVDVCVVENGGDPEALLENGQLTEKTKNLAACLISPCEPAEENEGRIYMQRNMYYLTNPDRVGTYIARIRRRKRRQSNPT